jgi:hypothetical protein
LQLEDRNRVFNCAITLRLWVLQTGFYFRVGDLKLMSRYSEPQWRGVMEESSQSIGM